MGAPIADERREQFAVQAGLQAVGLALVPDYAAQSKRNQRRDHAVEQRRRRIARDLRQLRLQVLQAVQVSFEVIDLEQTVAAGPGLGFGAAPCTVDEADRHIQRLAQTPAEKVGHGAEIAYRFRISFSPGTLAIRLRLRGAPPRYGEQAELRIRRCSDFRFGVAGFAHGKFHIRLAGTEPDLADEHIFQGDFIAPLDFDAVRAASGRRFERDLPAPVSAGLGFDCFAHPGCVHLHLFTRIGPAPDRHFRFLLQHHAIADDGRKFHFGQCSGAQKCRPKNNRPKPTHASFHGFSIFQTFQDSRTQTHLPPFKTISAFNIFHSIFSIKSSILSLQYSSHQCHMQPGGTVQKRKVYAYLCIYVHSTGWRFHAQNASSY